MQLSHYLCAMSFHFHKLVRVACFILRISCLFELISNDLGSRGGVAQDLKKTGRVAGIITLVIFFALVRI